MQASELKALIEPLRLAMASYRAEAVERELGKLVTERATIHFCHPFGDLQGGKDWQVRALDPLNHAMPDLERRDMIVMAGTTDEGQDWIGCMGNWMGTFVRPFLDIPPTGHLAHMRFHEFYRVEHGRISEVQGIWDIPELMMQAGAWPMAPQLGSFLCTPAPMSGDGLQISGAGGVAMALVVDMLEHLCLHPADPDPAVMQLQRFWHPRFNWYGPAGIGTARGIVGFRRWHQIPFLQAMPDRRLDATAELASHWIGEGQYVSETGWPNMRLTLEHDGWMGIAPAGREVLLRSLDFWRLEAGLIRENWVLVDLLHLYAQIGVDVLARMREFNAARNLTLDESDFP